MTMTLISMLHLLGMAQALFIGLLLTHPDRRSRANVILAALTLTLGAGLWEAFVHSSGLWKSLPLATGWFAATPFLFGPLLLAYIRRLIGDPDWSALRWLIHLSPTILFTLALLPVLVEPAEQRIDRILIAQQGLETLHPLNWAVLVIKVGHIIAYLLVASRRLIAFRADCKQSQSDTAVLRFRWLQRLCSAFVVLQLLWLALFLGASRINLPAGTTLDDFALLPVAALVFLIGYWGLSAPHLIPEPALVGPDGGSKEGIDDGSSPRYQSSGLSQEGAAELAQDIESALRDQSLYLQPRLRLSELAEAVGATPHMTSQAINEHLAGNFFELVNRFRVQEAARRLGDRDLSHLPIERIAYDCGFNNRTSFSRAFRDTWGTTPSRYRKAASAR